MKSITRQKPMEEIKEQLAKFDRSFIVGCGTCTTMTKTGGIDQVMDMKNRLQEADKLVSGWTVIPTACDEMTGVAMKENSRAIQNANCVLAMTCALGVHRMSLYLDRPVIPALDTLFIGVDRDVGFYEERCRSCGTCQLGDTGGICPVTRCSKGVLNGPCGGTREDGSCELADGIHCAWHDIYERLKAQGRVDKILVVRPPMDWVEHGPRVMVQRGYEGRYTAAGEAEKP